MKKISIIFLLLTPILYWNCTQRDKEVSNLKEKVKEKISEFENQRKSVTDTLSESDKENAKEAHNTIDVPDSTNNQTTKTNNKSDKKEEPIKKNDTKIDTKTENKKEPTKKSTYEKIGTYYKGVATTKTQGKMGLIDANGNEIIPPIYDFVEDFVEDVARVRTKDKVGFINKQGVEIVPLKYRYVDKFVNGLAKARLIDGETFFINIKGEHVCDILGAYHEGIARIKLGKNIGYVDMKGVVIIPTQYSYGTHFQKGVADVKKENKIFGINAKGVCVRDCQ